MSEAKYAAGATVFNQHGQQGEVVASVNGEYLVLPLYEDDDGEHFGDVETWRQVFRTPPSPKLDAETAAAEKRLAELNAQLSKVTSYIHKLNVEEKSRIDRIKQHDGLELLDRYLAGEITHYVAVHDYYPIVKIIPIAETLDDFSSSYGYGALTLRPTRDWDKKFYFTVYIKKRYPESDLTEKVYPCCGEEQAKAKAVAIMQGWVDDYAKLKPMRRSYFDKLLEQCKVFGVEVPQSMLDEQNAYKSKSLLDQADKKRKELADIEAAIAAATGAQP